ncbi:hypothetical protein P154DRAFT_235199 [Amniculicola lignicola CBS 123094]|uniref:Zn(2)-C6 fungal-type domain-containing protein n=1 Tax=Amniculicola lignicola CBS 123094 TaxID=1392246 RepID=A0A6A5WB76_9PLEO|nr:hypothetical protein P154DRAFT_235199 [Amniculicola lignicola CBS 123094]
MAETITIPPPPLFLNSPDPSPTQTSNSKPPRRSQQTAPKDVPKASNTNGIAKRKQSKSRNGCITCKAKRLKCDETKPTCQQCARRSVACGGYKKDFKWRPFEETTFAGKPPAKPKKGSSPPTSTPVAIKTESLEDGQFPIHNTYFHPMRPSVHSMQTQTPISPFTESPYPEMPGMYAIPQSSAYMYAPPAISPIDQFAPSSVESTTSVFGTESIDTKPTRTTAPSSVASGQSPRLVDLLLPGTDLTAPPEEYMSFRSQVPESFYEPFTPPPVSMDEDDIEEIPRHFDDHSSWAMRFPSPSPSNSSSSSTDSNSFPLLVQPQFSAASPEMLTRRFDRETCGILSVKDGPTENPWRTLVWPLARDCPALYHAIASMTSFHHSRESPSMRIQGIDHFRTSVHALAASLEKMRFDAAISTTLVLAFSESWDQHISTGMNHIKGAKILIDRALVRHSQTPVRGEELSRLKFLCNTWIYMDVIARLTSADEDESNDFDIVSDAIYMNGESDGRLDPLMGCASTLFPIIGRIANLVRKVRRTESNGPSIISKAVELKSQLEDWVPPAFIEDPEDETTSPHDSIKTATAYQYASLLYLHQAVPEIPSLPSHILAKRVMCELATVEPRSRSTIVHIYPLMAAGCEAMEEEDREWVQRRWETMAQRLKLGIIDKALEVTKEVWARRDTYNSEMAMNIHEQTDSVFTGVPSLKRDFSSMDDDFDWAGPFCWIDEGNKRRALPGNSPFDPLVSIPIKTEHAESRRRADVGTELLEHDYTVKGRLHWLGVMKDWNWEVLLG